MEKIWHLQYCWGYVGLREGSIVLVPPGHLFCQVPTVDTSNKPLQGGIWVM